MKYEINQMNVQILETEFVVGEGVYVLAAQYENGVELDSEELKKLEVIYQTELYAEATANQVEHSTYLAG